jgi:hypothetical protein
MVEKHWMLALTLGLAGVAAAGHLAAKFIDFVALQGISDGLKWVTLAVGIPTLIIWAFALAAGAKRAFKNWRAARRMRGAS